RSVFLDCGFERSPPRGRTYSELTDDGDLYVTGLESTAGAGGEDGPVYRVPGCSILERDPGTTGARNGRLRSQSAITGAENRRPRSELAAAGVGNGRPRSRPTTTGAGSRRLRSELATAGAGNGRPRSQSAITGAENRRLRSDPAAT